MYFKVHAYRGFEGNVTSFHLSEDAPPTNSIDQLMIPLKEV